MPQFKRGDKVTPDPDGLGVPPATLGRIFTVEKVNPKNLRCSADDGGRGINFPAAILLPATPENVEKAAAPPVGRPFVPVEFFSAGQVVTLKTAAPNLGATEATPLVVLKDDGRDRVNVALLGGNEDRYIRAPRAALVARDLAWLADRLMDEATA